MKTKFLFSAIVVSLLFIQQIAAQEVTSLLKSKEKRNLLYYSIINNDERFIEFMEAVKLAGRSEDGLNALQEKTAVTNKPSVALKNEITEDQKIIIQMLSLMKEFVDDDPALQKVIAEKYPDVNTLMKESQNKL